jgi:hypothetical protein
MADFFKTRVGTIMKLFWIVQILESWLQVYILIYLFIYLSLI